MRKRGDRRERREERREGDEGEGSERGEKEEKEEIVLLRDISHQDMKQKHDVQRLMCVVCCLESSCLTLITHIYRVSSLQGHHTSCLTHRQSSYGRQRDDSGV